MAELPEQTVLAKVADAMGIGNNLENWSESIGTLYSYGYTRGFWRKLDDNPWKLRPWNPIQNNRDLVEVIKHLKICTVWQDRDQCWVAGHQVDGKIKWLRSHKDFNIAVVYSAAELGKTHLDHYSNLGKDGQD